MFEQVTIDLQRAKDNYRASLRSVDSRLRQIVSQDPSALAGAKAIQASYGEDLDGAELAAAEQPRRATAAPGGKAKATRARTRSRRKAKTAK